MGEQTDRIGGIELESTPRWVANELMELSRRMDAMEAASTKKYGMSEAVSILLGEAKAVAGQHHPMYALAGGSYVVHGSALLALKAAIERVELAKAPGADTKDDLLAACEAALPIVRRGVGQFEGAQHALDAISAAIAKAKRE